MMTTAQKVAAALRGVKVPACKWNCLKWEWGGGVGKIKPPPPGLPDHGARGMCMAQDNYSICTLPAGHEGEHVACWQPGTEKHESTWTWPNEPLSKEQTTNKPKPK